MTDRDELRILKRLDSIDRSISSRLDKLEQGFGAVLAETSATRTEVRVVTALQHEHDARDNERFSAFNSDIRELKNRVLGVEDTSRRAIVTAEDAEQAIEQHDAAKGKTRDRRFDVALRIAIVLFTLAAGAVAARIF